MKTLFYISGTILLLIILYLLLAFFFYDYWVIKSSETQINSYVEKHDNTHLSQMSNDKTTARLLNKADHVNLHLNSDNQGSDDIGYYRIDLNGEPAEIQVKFDQSPFSWDYEIQEIGLIH